jgi:NTE family protein
MTRRLALLLVAVPLLVAGSSRAADTSEPVPAESPRVGLVLGGGGARGFAHIGVLQVLEENRIPVHAISGTSMGAVIGSLYASGKSAPELAVITDEIPWATVFNDNIPRDRLSFRRKRDERDVLLDYRISFDDKGLVLPKGVLRGQDLFLTLAEYLAPARSTDDFDRLAIPFRAVAADIVTGETIVMNSGDIATAAFASMSVPGGLPPVERDGRLLVDGGIVDNLPIDVVRSMGADRIIVVDVGTPLQGRDQISSFVSVINQLTLLLGRETVDRQIKSLDPADVLIRPDQPTISATGFERSVDGIAAGRAAALAVLDRLKPYALSEADWKAHLAARKARAPRTAPVVDFVKIVNRSDLPDRAIEERVTTRSGQLLDARQMTSDLQDIYALGGLRSVRYGLERGPEGGEGVIVTADGDPSSANWLQLGLGIATDFNRASSVRLGLAYTDRNFLDTGMEWRSDLRVGTDLLVETGLYTEFGRHFAVPNAAGRYFVEVTPYWSRIDTVLYEGSRAVSEVRDARVGIRLDGGLLFGNWGELRLGLNAASADLDVTIGSPDLVTDKLQDFDLNLTFTADTLDNIRFPTRGTFARIGFVDHLAWLGGDLDYSVLDVEVFKPVTRGRTTVLFSAAAGFTWEGDGRSVGDFRLGGFLNLSGLDENQLVGRHKLLGRAIVYHRLSEEAPLVDFPLYVGGSLEVGNAWASLDDISFGSLRTAGSLFVGADTPLGPFIIAAGLTRGNGALYLILGRIF